MRYRKQTPSGDYTFGNSALDFYVDVPEAVGLSVKTRLLLWLGEWFLDLNEGTPFLEGILGKHDLNSANVTIQDRVNATTGMVSIENYESSIDPDTRNLAVDFQINTIFGATTVSVNF